REPARMPHHEIKMIAVNDEVIATVEATMDRPFDNFDAAERRAGIVTQELVVIAGNVDQATAPLRELDQLPHDRIVRRGPIPARPQTPAIDDVADEEHGFGIMVTKEVDEPLCLASPGPEMDVGDEQAPDL